MSDFLLSIAEQYDAGAYAPWEPWVPPMGARVRVIVGPECREPGHLDPTNPDEYGWLERDTGVVVRIGDDDFRAAFPDGHWYGVLMDDSIALMMRLVPSYPGPSLDGSATPDDWYAASELILIADDAARPSAAREEG